MAYKSIFDRTEPKEASSKKSSSGYTSIFDKTSAPKKATKTATSEKLNLADVEQLKKYAESKGLEVKEKKPSLFVRTMDILSRPNYASAGAAKAIIKGNENPMQEAWKGLTGQEKETYSDVLKEVGVKNKIASGTVGFALDVALDPTTYLGGFIAKGAVQGAKLTGKGALATTKFFNPTVAKKIEVAGQGIKDALGNAFVHGYGTTAGLADEVTRYYNKLGIATDATIKSLDNAFKELPKKEHQEFAQTLLNFRKQLPELTETVGDRETAKKLLNELTPQFKTEAQKKFFKGTYKKIIDDMATSANLPENIRFEAYFPSIDTTRLKSPAGGRAVSLTDQSYKQLYEGVNVNELDKPIEALTRTSAKIFRDNLSKETLDNSVKLYGKGLDEFKDEMEAAANGYRLIKDKQFGKGVGYLKQTDFDFINNYLFPELKSVDLLAKNLGYDAFSRLFKTAVTSWFPAFHIRNALSGVVQNYQVLGARAFDPSNIPSALAVLKKADRQVKFGKNIYNTKELGEKLQEAFGKTSRYTSDLADYIQEITDGSYKVLKTLDPSRLGDFIEMNQKATAMVVALKQNKTIPEAIKLAEEAGFNYQKLTKFESKIMRRLIPFYSFMRKNAELQLKTLAKHPERILNQAKLANLLSNSFGQKVTEEDLQGVPPWALQGLGFKIKDNKYVSSLGLPLEEFFSRVNNPIMSTLSSLNPLVKYPLESKLGYDFFRQKKIIDLNQVSPVTGEVLYKAQQEGKLPKELSESINIKKTLQEDGTVKYTMSPEKLHLLRNIPTARLQNLLEKIFDKDIDSSQKMAAVFTGGKIYDINVEQQKYFTERDIKRDLEDWLLSIGEGKRMEKYYVPKEKEAK
jgi:hypothetical protein